MNVAAAFRRPSVLQPPSPNSVLRSLPCAVLLALGCAAPLAAQGVEAATFRLDNDILALRGREAPPDLTTRTDCTRAWN